MMASIRVAALLRAPVAPLSAGDSIRHAARRLVEERAAVLPVVDDAGRLIGVLSQKDCFDSALVAAYHQEWRGTVADHMSRDPLTIDADTELVEAARWFQLQPHRVYPVLRGPRLVGMLRRSDVLRALLSLSGADVPAERKVTG